MSNNSTQIATSQTGREDLMFLLVDDGCLMNDCLYNDFFAPFMGQPLDIKYLTDLILYLDGTDIISPVSESRNLLLSHAAMNSLDSLLELPFGLDQNYALGL